MGFGHRVYKNYDPRAKIMQKTCHEVLDAVGHGDDPILKVAMELERIALSDDYFIQKKLYPNIDFYSGITLKALGFPTDMFTVLFAIARTVGWIAQWKEMIEDPLAAHRQAASALYGSDRASLRAGATRARRRRSSVSRSPTRKSPCRLAAAMVAARSAIKTRPAATAMPARPAAAAFFTVSGPIVGRSTRSSCPGFGALTRTPLLARCSILPISRSSAQRASMASVPSAASTAST